MNIELFLAQRLNKQTSSRFSQPIIRIATLAIAVSVAVMILATAVVTGFQKEIRDKVIGFGSHIQITHFADGNSYESQKISKIDSLKISLEGIDDITHIQNFATKAGIIKTKEEIQGVILKGVGSDFNPSFFENNLKAGNIEVYNDTLTSRKVVISNKLAKQLQLQVDEKMVMYFVQNPPRARTFVIGGIYETGLAELDEIIVLGDIRHIQKLNGWKTNESGGLEVSIANFDDIEAVTQKVYHQLGFNLNAQNIQDLHPQIFDWLNLQDLNIQVIIILMIIVAAINMITTLLILILEHTQLIGTLKALGANNWSIRKVFLYNSAYLIGKGLLWGNIAGIGLALIQFYFEPIRLDAATYYMSVVPIHLKLVHLFLLNSGAFIVCWSALIIPSYLISKITPIKAIRFE
ncbi:MAG: ABC transporter permease [Flavobacteriales bacterium]|nr:ABC transporter permease [Flavobacteriales bacterium]